MNHYFYCLIIGMILSLGALIVISTVNLKTEITENHKVVLSQIEKQINTQTEFIKALRECLEDE